MTTVQRRRFLPLAAAALAGCVGPSDGSGPRNPPTTPEGGVPVDDGRDLRIGQAAPREGEDGALVFAVTVENTAGGTRSDTLVGRATVDGESGSTEYEARREVTLDGGAVAEFDLVFDVAYEAWAGSGDLAYGWEGEI